MRDERTPTEKTFIIIATIAVVVRNNFFFLLSKFLLSKIEIFSASGSIVCIYLEFLKTLWLFFRMRTKLYLGIILLGIFHSITLSEAIPNYSGLPPGPYCAGRFRSGQCCPGRQDDCSAPILTTTCYCDDFCNRTREEDCCPDYWSHCRGISLPDEPEALRRNFSLHYYFVAFDDSIVWKFVWPIEWIVSFSECFFRGKYYNHGETFKLNCNTW